MGLGSSFGITSETNNNIQTDGLVGYWDAAYKKSYPRSGTTWIDLAGSNNATLVNGPTFSTVNGGSITVDGSNDSINISSGSGDFSFTSEMFMEVMVVPKEETHVRPIVVTNSQEPWRLIMVSNTGTSGEFFFNWNVNVDGANNTVSTAFYVQDESYILQCGYDGTEVFAYMNGVKQSDTESATGDIDTLTKDISIGGDAGYSPSRHANLDIGFVRLYNRCLSDGEIIQNYNATKQRLGL
jgi:hypothetical protein